ncbi:MAG: hypothetical protein ACPGD8_01655 [Flavobacteriales bacterium]
MKFIKAFIVVLLLCTSVLVLIGVFIPEIDKQIEMNVKAPVVSVYAGMMNTQDMPEWVESLQKIERTGGILAMPGSTFDLHFESKETDVVYQLEILEMVPLQSIKYRLHNEMLDIEVSTKFGIKGVSTDVDTFVQVKGNDFLVRCFLPLMRSVVMDEFENNFQNFKELQER